MPPFLWSARTRRFWQPWEAWVETEGRVIRSTLDFAWTREAAERKARKRWDRLQTNNDVPGSRRGVPIDYIPDREGAVT